MEVGITEEGGTKMAYPSNEDRKRNYRKGRSMVPGGRDMIPYKKKTYPLVPAPRLLGQSPNPGKNPLTVLPPKIKGTGSPPKPPQAWWRKGLNAAGKYGGAFLRSPLGRSSIYTAAGYAAYEGQDWLFKHLNRKLDQRDAAAIDKITGHIPPHRERYPVGPPKGPTPVAPSPTPPPSATPGPGSSPPMAPPRSPMPPKVMGPGKKKPPKRGGSRIKKTGMGGSAKASGGGTNWTHLALAAAGGYALSTLMQGTSGPTSGGGGYNYYAGRSRRHNYFN